MAILLRKNQTRTWNGCSITDTSRRRVGSLADRNPELAKEWHPIKNGDLTPAQVTPGSGKKVWWRCSRGHEWEAMVKSRTRGTGCPYCYRERRQRRN
ncbi:hypothetical protein CL673_03350 [Candidatus Bathyarchaeota archaeon]|nr:hypothetical protein [Candidatus Bathyarchaeota archaeon]MDP6048008.1 zinc-ribbon domain-containing protein [Candidatus Bathyarchaeota archaeon]MDP7206982.1 zinc-ribbon domain-containing protein [Candidatus Bathyarchaeota archaeon]MDP7443157.1 zinc-ribbon domain-containing protein [Candidatus Bathyarchaeota archaeon]